LADLNNLFSSSEKKEIFIFDEAENNLDKNNREIIHKKIKILGLKKLVIVMNAK